MNTNIIEILQSRTRIIGKAPLCNLNKERGFRLFGFYFPFCFRCTGLLIGFIILYVFKEQKISTQLDWYLRVIFLIALPLDYILNSHLSVYSSNILRLFTGILFFLALV